MQQMPTETLTTTLRDGSPVLIRPVIPDDKPVLREAFTRLSQETRYRRFMHPVKELSEKELDYSPGWTTPLTWPGWRWTPPSGSSRLTPPTSGSPLAAWRGKWS